LPSVKTEDVKKGRVQINRGKKEGDAGGEGKTSSTHRKRGGRRKKKGLEKERPALRGHPDS